MPLDPTIRGEIESVIDDYVKDTAGNMEFIRDINYKRTRCHPYINQRICVVFNKAIIILSEYFVLIPTY